MTTTDMLSFKDFTDYCDLTEDGLRPLKNSPAVQELGLNVLKKPTPSPVKTPQQTLQYLRNYLDYIESNQRT